jgi:hypothetical protein
VLARGAEAPLRDVLLAARERLPLRFAAQQETEASVRASLATLFATLDLWAEAEQEITRALELFDAELGAASTDSVRARALRVHLLARLSRFEDAEAELARLEAAAVSADPAVDMRWPRRAPACTSTVAVSARRCRRCARRWRRWNSPSPATKPCATACGSI